MKMITNSKLFIKLICFIIVFLTLFDYSFSINKENILRYLGEDLSGEIKITYEFPFTCGNSYLISKRICNDITNELLRRNLNIVQTLEGKNVSNGKLNKDKDTFFNIYLVKDNNKILLATTNPKSKFYSENLTNYPEKFVKFNSIPQDADFTKKFEIAKVLQERIINNL